MDKITITEALAELPTIDKRIAKKKEFVLSFLYRQSIMRDPHEQDGGSYLLIERERQAIKDLMMRRIAIRTAIQQANLVTKLTIGDVTMSIAEWLVWRKEVAPVLQDLYRTMSNGLSSVRKQAQQRGVGVTSQDNGPTLDVVVNVNEKQLAESIEYIETTLGTLDGKLSLTNATVVIEI